MSQHSLMPPPPPRPPKKKRSLPSVEERGEETTSPDPKRGRADPLQAKVDTLLELSGCSDLTELTEVVRTIMVHCNTESLCDVVYYM
jgi:hypothetical protein